MKLLKSILVSIFLWLIAINGIVLLALIPAGEPTEADIAMAYYEQTARLIDVFRHFEFEDYKSNVVGFYSNLFANDGAFLGTSEAYKMPVEELVWGNGKRSLLLVLPAFFLGIIFGILKGIYDFRKNKKRFSIFGERSTNFFLAVPDFMVVLLIQIMLLELIDFGLPRIDLYGEDGLSNVILGIIFLTIYPTMYIAKSVNLSLQEEQGYDYVRTAISKGTSEKKIISRHMLSNAYIKLLGQFPTVMLYIISSLFIVEHLMMYRGATVRLFEHMADPQVLFGFALFFSLIMLITDVLSQVFSYSLRRRVS
ncbi:ABC transporter permease subunit [Bacillaceae bacterium W0354]